MGSVQRLDRLLNEVDVFERSSELRRVEVTSLCERTQDAAPGCLFFCVPGERNDGHDFAREALAKGAVAVVVERELDVEGLQIRVENVRVAMAQVAAEFYDRPDRRLRIAGITGTNGKTTTAALLSTIFEHHHWPTLTIGTLSGQYTSPPSLELQRMLAGAVSERKHAVVMEVSSHALVQHRVDSIKFIVAIFTNLTQDHLDYHKTMGEYFRAKSLLFDPGRIENAVVNIDDEYGRQLLERIAVPATTFGLDDARNLRVTPRGSSFEWDGEHVDLRLLGKFNVYNALGAATAAKAAGIPTTTIVEALNAVTPVRGRMEQIERGQSFSVVVDFAHTPDGLENVLSTARELVAPQQGRVLVVFGCGGDRDAGKRPQMGAIAERLADDVVVTTDNSRSEDPRAIADAVVAGMTHGERAHIYLDRRQAITQAIAHARRHDIVVIAGKGHETTQDIGGVKTPFDDRQVATEVLQRLAAQT